MGDSLIFSGNAVTTRHRAARAYGTGWQTARRAAWLSASALADQAVRQQQHAAIDEAMAVECVLVSCCGIKMVLPRDVSRGWDV